MNRLGRVASPNGGINSLVLASGCCPVRFDLDHSLFSKVKARLVTPMPMDCSVRNSTLRPRPPASLNRLV